MTSQQHEALAALRTRSDWDGGYGQPQMMTLPYSAYGWLFAEVRLAHQQAQYEQVLATADGVTLAELQAEHILAALAF